MDQKVTVGLEARTTETVQGIDAVSREVGALLGNLGLLETRLREIFSANGQMPQHLKKLEGYIKQLNTVTNTGNQLGQITRTSRVLSTGGPDTAIRNAALRGVVSTLQADPVVQALKYEKELNKVYEARRTIFQRLREASPTASLDELEKAYQKVLRSLDSTPLKGKALTEWRARTKAEVVNFDADLARTRLEATDRFLAQQERREADALNRRMDRERKARADYERSEANHLNRQFDRDRANMPAARQERQQRSAISNQERLDAYGGAGLMATQARVFGNYAAFGAALSTVGFATTSTVQLQAALKNTQAIAKATDLEMKTLTKTVFEVGQTTRFATKDIAEAATTMAQAGYSANQIKEALPAVAALATGAGASMSDAVNIVTSVLNIYDLAIDRTAEVSNKLAEALNGSKLSLEQLSLGVQYAGNIAKDGGVQFEELTAALGAMANAGIKSGSTLGTGLRALIKELESPSLKFQKVLEQIGLTADDVDVKTQGLGQALENLSLKGFDSATAMEVFELRAAAAFSALANNLDTFEQLQLSLNNTNAANEAAATQMESLVAQFMRLGNAITELTTTAGGPFLIMLQQTVGLLATVISGLAQTGPAIQIVTTFLLALLAIQSVIWLGNMAKGFIAMRREMIAIGTAAPGLITSLIGISTTATTATGALRAMTAAMLTNPVFLIAAAITGLTLALTGFETAQTRAAQKIEEFRTKANEAGAEAQKYGDRVSEINDYLEKLTNRHHMLSSSQGALNQEVEIAIAKFGSWGDQLHSNIGTVDQLISRMGKLRAEMEAVRVDALRTQDAALAAELQAVQKKNRAAQSGSRMLAAQLARPIGYGSYDRSTEQMLRSSGATPLLQKYSQGTLSPDEVRQLESILRANASKLPGIYKIKVNDLLGQLGSANSLQERSIQSERNLLATQIGTANLRASPQATAIGSQARTTYITISDRERQAQAIKDPVARNAALAALRREVTSTIQPGLDKYIDDNLRASLSDPLTSNGIRQRAMRLAGTGASEAQIQAAMMNIAREQVIQQNPDIARVAMMGGNPNLSNNPAILSARVKAIDREIATARQARDSGRVAALTKEKQDTEKRLFLLKNPDLDPREAEAALAEIDTAGGASGASAQRGMGRQTARIETVTLRRRAAALEKTIDGLSASTDGSKDQTALKEKLAEWKSVRIEQIRSEAEAGGLSSTELEERLKDFEVEAAEYTSKILEGNLAAAKELLASSAARAAEDGANRTETNLGNGSSTLRQGLDDLKASVDAALQAEIEAETQKFKTQNPLADATTAPEMIQRRQEIQRKWAQFTLDQSLKFVEAVYRADELRQQQEMARADLDLGARSARVQALSNPYGMRNLSDTQRVLGAKRQEEIEVDAARNAVSNAQQSLARERAKRDSIQALYDAEPVNSVKATEYRKELDAANIKVQEMANAWERSNQALEALTAELPAFMGWSEAIKGAWEAFAYQAGLTKPIFEEVAQGLQDTFSVMQNGLKSMVKDVLSGTKSMGQAFKDFTISVLDALLDMAAKIIANKILMWIIKTAGSLWNPGGSAGSAGAQGAADFTDAPVMFGAVGGRVPGVRMAGGGRPIPNRDSVHIFGMPGEVIMRKSAVDMIGEDKLLALNAMGNRRLGEVGQIAPPAPREPDMVNVYVVSPDQKPPMGARDIVAVITDDIQTGGPTKKLVKAVAMGAM